MSQLAVYFEFQGKTISVQCLQSDKIDDVFNKYCQKAGLDINDVTFYFNSREVKRSGKTLFALGIVNYGKFNVVQSKYLMGANF